MRFSLSVSNKKIADSLMSVRRGKRSLLVEVALTHFLNTDEGKAIYDALKKDDKDVIEKIKRSAVEKKNVEFV